MPVKQRRQKVKVPDRYGLVKIGYYSDGTVKYISRDMEAILHEGAKITGYPWDVTQGCRHGGSLSGNTHLGTSVGDITGYEAERRTKILKNLGCFVWPRDERDSSSFSEHIHWGIIGAKKMDPTAKAQARDFLLGLNGLANHGRDRYPARVDPQPTFNYRKWYLGQEVGNSRDVAVKQLHGIKNRPKLYTAVIQFLIRFRKRSNTDH